MAINCGALAGGNFPTAALGVVFRGLMETAYEAEPALTAPDSFSEEFKIFGFAIVFSLILIAILPLWLQGQPEHRKGDHL